MREQKFLQIIFLLLAAFLVFKGLEIANSNIDRLGIASGFGFLSQKSGFSVIQTPIDYDETSTYLRLFYVGLCNTLIVSLLGIFLATFLGFLIGAGICGSQPLIRTLGRSYIETLRNIPLIIQILIWYFLLLKFLPSPRDSIHFLDWIFVNNRGMYFAFPHVQNGVIAIDKPLLSGFNFEGGVCLIPELSALLLALSTYTASFIAEIVRAGIQGVPKEQLEAAFSLGLSEKQTLKHIILPQGMRLIIPPLTSQYLNLTKNSSLATVIGYPDLVAVFAGTALNQTGQAIETIIMTMCVYMFLSLTTSLFMNWFNERYQI